MTNIILSWLSAVLVLLCSSLYPLRKLSPKYKPIRNLWLFLRKIHIPLGLLTTVVVILHCRVAFEVSGQRSLLGVILLVCMLGLCATGFIKRISPRYWLHLHRGITAIMFTILIIHSFIEFNL